MIFNFSKILFKDVYRMSVLYPDQLQLAQVNLYTRKDFKSSLIWSYYEKQPLILNELKASLMLKFSLQNSLQSFESLCLI